MPEEAPPARPFRLRPPLIRRFAPPSPSGEGFAPERKAAADPRIAAHGGAFAPVDLEADVDFVAMTGKIFQRDRMSFASLVPEDARPHADILVTGDVEGPPSFGGQPRRRHSIRPAATA